MKKQTTSNNQWQFFARQAKDNQLALGGSDNRVIAAVVEEGARKAYFESINDAQDFKEELEYIISSGRACFSPSTMALFGNADRRTGVKNSNKSLRIKNSLMRAVQFTEAQTSPEITKAKQLFSEIIKEHQNVEFSDNLSKWRQPFAKDNYHTGSQGYKGIADTAANINLLKYQQQNGTFDYVAFQYTVELLCIALDILIGFRQLYTSDTPSQFAQKYRPLALGYTNLGLLILSQGIAYDSEEARAQAATITALMTGQAYLTSTKLARSFGPFAAFYQESEPIITLLQQYRKEIPKIRTSLVAEELLSAAVGAWDEAVTLGRIYGLRHIEVTCLGSRSLFDPVDYLVADATRLPENDNKISANQKYTLMRSLNVLGYTQQEITDILEYIDVKNTIKHAPYLKKQDISLLTNIIDVSCIDYSTQLKMMMAIQPFLSGTIDIPIYLKSPLSPEEAERVYLEAWAGGLKVLSFAIHDYLPEHDTGSPIINHAATTLDSEYMPHLQANPTTAPSVVRSSKTFIYHFANTTGYITVCEDDSEQPTEIIVKLSDERTEQFRNIEDIVALLNTGLSYGITIKEYAKVLVSPEHKRFKEISMPRSIVLLLANHYLSYEERLALKLVSDQEASLAQTSLLTDEGKQELPNEESAGK